MNHQIMIQKMIPIDIITNGEIIIDFQQKQQLCDQLQGLQFLLRIFHQNIQIVHGTLPLQGLLKVIFGEKMKIMMKQDNDHVLLDGMFH
jgi:hypothetical protein